MDNIKQLHSDLLEQCKRQDTKAQMALYGLYAKSMFNVAQRMLSNHMDAEDVMQEAFLKAFANLESFRQEASFGSWLKRIVVNQCLDVIKKRTPDFADLLDQPEVAELQESTWNGNQQLDEVMLAMDLLPQTSKLVLTLHLIEGYDHQEIAQMMNTSYGAIRTKYSRAKAHLIQLLQHQSNVN